jgi:hypothetical protein
MDVWFGLQPKEEGEGLRLASAAHTAVDWKKKLRLVFAMGLLALGAGSASPHWCG